MVRRKSSSLTIDQRSLAFLVNVKMVDGFVMINQSHLEHVHLLVLHI